MTVHRLPDAPRPVVDVEDAAVKTMGAGCLLAFTVMVLSIAATFAAGAVWMFRAALGH